MNFGGTIKITPLEVYLIDRHLKPRRLKKASIEREMSRVEWRTPSSLQGSGWVETPVKDGQV